MRVCANMHFPTINNDSISRSINLHHRNTINYIKRQRQQKQWKRVKAQKNENIEYKTWRSIKPIKTTSPQSKHRVHLLASQRAKVFLLFIYYIFILVLISKEAINILKNGKVKREREECIVIYFKYELQNMYTNMYIRDRRLQQTESTLQAGPDGKVAQTPA